MDVILEFKWDYLCSLHPFVHLLERTWLGVFTSVSKAQTLNAKCSTWEQFVIFVMIPRGLWGIRWTQKCITVCSSARTMLLHFGPTGYITLDNDLARL